MQSDQAEAVLREHAMRAGMTDPMVLKAADRSKPPAEAVAALKAEFPALFTDARNLSREEYKAAKREHFATENRKRILAQDAAEMERITARMSAKS